MDVAQGRAQADLIIRNARVVNVFTKQIEELEVAVAAGTIAWIGKPDPDKPRQAALYMMPGKVPDSRSYRCPLSYRDVLYVSHSFCKNGSGTRHHSRHP